MRSSIHGAASPRAVSVHVSAISLWTLGASRLDPGFLAHLAVAPPQVHCPTAKELGCEERRMAQVDLEEEDTRAS
jgi:hypothetical protein